ncbi:MAG: hypothetical protein ACMXYC_00670 [Candidatus Woesearchaeota archaeon]
MYHRVLSFVFIILSVLCVWYQHMWFMQGMPVWILYVFVLLQLSCSVLLLVPAFLHKTWCVQTLYVCSWVYVLYFFYMILVFLLIVLIAGLCLWGYYIYR